MTLPLSGPLSLSDLAGEFGDTVPYSLSEFYRNGGKVPGVNTNVPESGTIALGDFYGAVNELVFTATSQASLNAQTAFGANWGAAVPKRLLVPSGVTLGPLTIPTGLGSTLTVQNEGEIQGLGGAANGGAGGNAITASSSFTLNNTGAVRGGGGGGGLGGTGGQGQFTTFVTQGPFGDFPAGSNYAWTSTGEFNHYSVTWDGVFVSSGQGADLTSVVVGGITYLRGGFLGNAFSTSDGETTSSSIYQVSRQFNQTTYTSGGAGGAGGRGQGYAQSLAAGSAGSAGGTNAGTGGTGGTGGNWGLVGATGATGASGNYTAGLAGATGGAAGRAVLMSAGTLTLNNSGTLNGAY